MPELPTYLAQKALPRPHRGGVGGAPGLPGVPDVSGVYRATAQVGGEIGDLGATLGELAARKQKARDVATLVELEAQADVALSGQAEELRRDQSIHPFDYKAKLETYRAQYVEQATKALRGDLQPLAKAKIQA